MTYYVLVRGMPSKFMHPFQQQGSRHFPIYIVPAESIDELVTILNGKKISTFEDEHEIFLPRVLFSGVGHRSSENVSYDVGDLHFETENKTDGLTLWVKSVPMMQRRPALV
jgi:hypothetical protein